MLNLLHNIFLFFVVGNAVVVVKVFIVFVFINVVVVVVFIFKTRYVTTQIFKSTSVAHW